MATFDKNSWYQLNAEDNTIQSLHGTPIYDEGKGAVYFKLTNTTAAGQHWQIFPFNATHHVLRCKNAGSRNYLNTRFMKEEETLGNTRLLTMNYTISTNSMFWQITPWGDGTFDMTNAENGTAWHMNRKPDGLVNMNSNMTAPQLGQKWSFTQLEKIDNSLYSSVLTATATTPPTTSSTTSLTTSTTPPATIPTNNVSNPAPTPPIAATNGGLSTGVKAAIGASIGGLLLVIAVLVGFILFKRRKRNNDAAQILPPYVPSEEKKYDSVSQEMLADNSFKHEVEAPMRYEMASPPVELPGQMNPMELPAIDARR